MALSKAKKDLTKSLYVIAVFSGSFGLMALAQSPPALTSPEQVQAVLLGDMRGEAAGDLRSQYPQSHNGDSFEPFQLLRLHPPTHSPGETISINQLQHKVPKDALQAAGRAKKWSRMGQHSKAAVELEAAIRRDPEFTSAQYALGIEYGRCGRFEEAAAAFRHVTQSAPADWSGHYYLNVAMFRGGELGQAIRSARRAFWLHPTEKSVNLFLGYPLSLRIEPQPELTGISSLHCRLAAGSQAGPSADPGCPDRCQ
jgi:Flp pilus assembly protein TadD